MSDESLGSNQSSLPPVKNVIPPTPGEQIMSLATGNSYTMGEKIGEGFFGVVYSCLDIWGNDLAAKVLKPIGTYEKVRSSAEAELRKLALLRHPHVTYVYDAFEFRDTFYIVTERCYCPLTQLFSLNPFNGLAWLIPIARCVLQAVHYLHLNQHAHQDIHLGNVFAAFAKDEMRPGVAKLFGELDATNTRAEWMLPPEAIDPAEFGAIDYRIDLYHIGQLLLQFAFSRELRFSREEILSGRPREMALSLQAPYSFALEKALRRHVTFRTAGAMELWRDLHTPHAPALPNTTRS